jgi:pimeloyl-ACP methyl ester carboxylesterase
VAFSLQGELRLYYELHGAGPDVLLVHGGFSRGDVEWAELLPRLTGFRAIVPDLRGHGRSDNPDRSLDRKGAGADLARLLDELEVRDCRVVAFSMGCHLALSLALLRPELVSRLVLIGPTKEMDETLVRRFRRAHPERSAEAGEAWALALRALHPPERWKRLMEALGDGTVNHPDWSDEELTRVRCPVLVVYGDRDYYGAATQQPQRLAAALPDSRLVVLPGPHGVHRADQGGHPDAVGEAITAFLKET